MKVFKTILLTLISITCWGQINNPYLQTPTSTSIWVTWQTSYGTETEVEYGTSSNNLNQSTSGASDALSSNWIWHKVRLSGLQPNTAYYYRVKTGSQTSGIKRFVTQPTEGTSTGHYRMIIMGDHQRSDDRYAKLVLAAKAKAETRFGSPVEDHVNLILNPGDVSSEGDRLDQWLKVHIGQGAPLTGNIPSVTVVGNHDDGGTFGPDPDVGGDIGFYSRIFTYSDDDDFHYNNLKGNYGDNFYSFQVANIAFFCLNSNQYWADQTNFAEDVIDEATDDSDIEWLLGTAHHPFWAEQLPGDAENYMIGRIKPLMEKSYKAAMYVSGHAHLYARGALPELPMCHTINGGASFDQYWTEYNADTDFENVQKTIIRQVYQLVDFDLDNREMHVETYSIGSSHGRFNEDKLIDSYYLKLDANKPNKPSMTIPNTVTLPYEFEGSIYSGDEPNNSTEFQFAGPAADFANQIYRSKRDFENIFYNGSSTWEITNLNENVDIFKVTVPAASLYQGVNHARVRYRDQSMHWSDWSDPTPFTATNGGLGNPPETDAIAYFPFNNNLNDESTAGKDFDFGTNNGATYVSDPTRGAVMSFDGNDMITIQDGTEAYDGLPEKNMTVSTWVKLDKVVEWGGLVGAFQDTGADEFGWVLGTRGQRFSFAVVGEDNGAITYLSDDEDYNLGEWYHVLATYNGNEMKLYVNNEHKVTSTRSKGNIKQLATGNFVIGAYKDNDEDFRMEGLLDEVTIWERALGDEEIDNVYNGITTSTKDIASSGFNIKFYPNPANDVINVNLNGEVRVKITSALGSTVYDQQLVGNSKIELSDFAKGIYVIQINGKDINRSEKLIIK